MTLDTASLLAALSKAASLASLLFQGYLKPAVESVQPHITKAMDSVDQQTQYIILAITLLLSTLFLYRTARSALAFLFGLFMALIQIGIFVLLLLIVVMHSERLSAKLELVTEAIKSKLSSSTPPSSSS